MRLLPIPIAMLLAALLLLGAPGLQVDDAAEEALRPLVVNGVRIPTEEIQRFLIYGAGRKELELRRDDWLIQWGAKQRQLEGLESSGEVTQARILWEIEDRLNELREGYPDLDLETEVRRRYRTRDLFERQIAQELRFEQVFLTPDPDLWPAVSFEALQAEAEGVLVEDYRESYRRRLQFSPWKSPKALPNRYPDGQPALPPEDPMYRSILRTIIREHILASFGWRTATDGLPLGLVLTLDTDDDGVSELSIATHELWDAVSSIICVEDVRRARRYLALREALEQRLPGAGSSSFPDEIKERHLRDVKRPCCSPYGSGRFPSCETYWDHQRLLRAYREWISPSLWSTPEGELGLPLLWHLEQAKWTLGLAKVRVEATLISILDFKRCRWRLGGWAAAREHATSLYVDLQREPELWPEVLRNQNDFWDQPKPRGRFDHRVIYRARPRPFEGSRGRLRKLFYEDDYTLFLEGVSVADTALLEAPVGEVSGPYKGQLGYYLLRVVERLPPTLILDATDPKQVGSLIDDYVEHSFIQFAHEALRSSRVVGLDED